MVTTLFCELSQSSREPQVVNVFNVDVSKLVNGPLNCSFIGIPWGEGGEVMRIRVRVSPHSSLAATI